MAFLFATSSIPEPVPVIKKYGNTTFNKRTNLMPITGHGTMISLEKYLRDIDAELPKDYSNMLYDSEKGIRL